MSQITSGFRSILSYPLVYSAFQYIMGAHGFWQTFTRDTLCVKAGDKVLDIGCGPADVLQYLPQELDYWGFDISPEYIQRAKLKYGDRGHFFCKLLEPADLESLPKFDRVILTGVFHHLDDKTSKDVVSIAYQALKDDGKLVSIDPCYTSKQNPIARFLISKDRGQNVRIESEYKLLVNKTFKNVQTRVVHKAWIPYTHCYMVCTK
jgi:SAM-dependent methyltransferase